MSLVRRAQEHNAGLGLAITRVPTRIPWIVCAYVTGFNWTNAGQRIRLFEKEWFDAASLYVKVKKSHVSLPTAVPLAENIART